MAAKVETHTQRSPQTIPHKFELTKTLVRHGGRGEDGELPRSARIHTRPMKPWVGSEVTAMAANSHQQADDDDSHGINSPPALYNMISASH